jgi:nucleotide-binding universal stress UspA family protein
MVLICYDGSADAQAAIDEIARLMPGHEVTVLTVWETLLETMTRNGSLGAGLGMVGMDDDAGADAAIRRAAKATAAQGAERANAAGLMAQSRIVNRNGDIVATILAVAAELDTELIALGTRGLGGLKSLLLGSVSRAMLHHCDRAVLVVPSARLVEQRRHWTENAQLAAGVA